jgi:hypothetical protein
VVLERATRGSRRACDLRFRLDGGASDLHHADVTRGPGAGAAGGRRDTAVGRGSAIERRRMRAPSRRARLADLAGTGIREPDAALGISAARRCVFVWAQVSPVMIGLPLPLLPVLDAAPQAVMRAAMMGTTHFMATSIAIVTRCL